MKKVLCSILAILILATTGVVFTGCGSDNSKDSSSSKVETKAETTTEEVTEPTTEEVTEEETTTEATKPKATKKTTSQKSNSTSGVNANFKATMDSYEEFFNDYVDFMKKYKNSTDITSMASDYADYMTKYSNMMQKLNDIKSEDLSTADLAYYNEVNARITKKLAEVAN